MPTLYSFGNAANVSSNNFTTLYNTGAGIVNPQMAYGNANVESFLAVGSDAGGNTVGNIISSGNITADYFFGNIVGNIIGNLVVPGANTEVLFNNNGNVGASANLTFNGAVLSVVGNAAANYFIGNGSQLTGLPAGYSNAQVASYLSSGNVTSNIITTGNVSGAFILGNGSQLTGLPAGYSNAQVASYLSSGTVTSNIITTANVQGGNLIGAVWTNSITGSVAAANIDISPDGAGHVNLNTDVVRIGDNNTDAVLATRGTGNLTIKPHEGDANQSLINIVNGVNGNIELTNNGTGNVNTARISASGNITAAYYFGNGSQLTGITASSNYSNANVVSLLSGFGSNTISTTGNISGGVFAGNGSALTNITGANVTGTVANATNAGTVTTAAQPNITSVGILTSVTSTGNISTTGNVTGGFIFGNGSQLTGITASSNYSNANVASFLAVYGANIISATGNITTTANIEGGWLLATAGADVSGNLVVSGGISAVGSLIRAGVVSASGNIISGLGGFFVGDGRHLTNLVIGTQSSLSVTGNTITGNLSTPGLITATGNIISAGTISATDIAGANTLSVGGNITAGQNIFLTGQIISGSANLNFMYSQSVVSAVGNITGGNIRTAGLITATGNVTGAYFIGNGSQLTGVTGTYGNANVATYLASGTNTSNIITTGNVTAGNLTTTGIGAVVTTSVQSGYLIANAASGTTLTVTANAVVGNLSTAGNVTAGFFLGNGSQLTGIVSSYGNANVATYLASGTNTANIITTGNVTGGNLTTAGNVSTANVYATGLLSAAGAVIGSSLYGNIVSISANITGGNLRTAGIVSATGNITSAANISGSFILGNGAFLTGIAASYSNADVATYLASGTNTSNIISTGNVTGGNVLTGGAVSATGTVTGSSLLGSVVSASANITGGNLVTGGVISATGNITAVANIAGGNILTVGLISATGNIISAGNVSGAFILGNGSQLTGIVSSYGNANVAANLAAFGSNPISSTGNITTTANISGSFILGNGAFLTGIASSSYGNADVAANLAAFGSNPISSTGNITTTANIAGNFFLGNGSQLTGISASATKIFNGTSEANIGVSNGNANITIGGVSNVAVFATTGVYIGGVLAGNSTTSGVTVTNYKDNVYNFGNATGTITPDPTNGSVQYMTLTGSITMNAFGGTPQAGQSLVLVLTQDATGGRTLTSTMKFAGGNKTLSTAANAIDVISVVYANGVYYASLTKGYA